MKKRIVVWVMSLCMMLSAAVQMPAVTVSAQESGQETGIVQQQENISTAVAAGEHFDSCSGEDYRLS